MGKLRLSLGLSEAGKQLAGGRGAAASVCVAAAGTLMPPLPRGWGSPPRQPAFLLFLLASSTIQKLRECKSRSHLLEGTSAGVGSSPLQAWDALCSPQVLGDGVQLDGILGPGWGCSLRPRREC